VAKRIRLLTKQSALKRWESGRGQGEGASYIPWLLVQDVASNGLATRIKGWKHPREHHLFSNGEIAYFYQLEWLESVTDFREQFPLWPIEETQEIANLLGLKHPDPHRGDDKIAVMTSDFRITADDGSDVVRTVKTVGDLKKRRTIEKLEIERHYWERRGIDWGIVVANDIPKAFLRNMIYVHKHQFIDLEMVTADCFEDAVQHFTKLVRQKDTSLAVLAKVIETKYKFAAGFGLNLARHLIATRRWKVDMDVIINPSRIMSLLEDDL
jgi:hypothetical protein